MQLKVSTRNSFDPYKGALRVYQVYQVPCWIVVQEVFWAVPSLVAWCYLQAWAILEATAKKLIKLKVLSKNC